MCKAFGKTFGISKYPICGHYFPQGVLMDTVLYRQEVPSSKFRIWGKESDGI